ncbi:unnamed protein product [Gordionus sp. m RMFG-2023]
MKKCSEIRNNSGDCNDKSDIFVPCNKEKSPITSKEANNNKCNDILMKVEIWQRIYRYILNKNSCKLHCKITCRYFLKPEYWECKNKTTEPEYAEYLKNEFVVNGTQLSNDTLCINNEIHILSKYM